jgi:mRNA interferase RelE/StbE
MIVVVGLGRRKDGDKKDIYSILVKLIDISGGVTERATK